jgi:predicted Fe-Mo cluster-binding NifX family protein
MHLPGGRWFVKIAIPRLGESVAPCFEYSATVAIFTVVRGQVVEQVDFPLVSRDPFDRVRLMRDQQVNTIICGGMQERFEDMIKTNGIEVISWMSGTVEDLLGLYIRGRLAPGKRSEPPGSVPGVVRAEDRK